MAELFITGVDVKINPLSYDQFEFRPNAPFNIHLDAPRTFTYTITAVSSNPLDMYKFRVLNGDNEIKMPETSPVVEKPKENTVVKKIEVKNPLQFLEV